MAKKMLIDATHAEETRVVVVDGTKVEEFDFESDNKRQLAGNIYLAKVTRVEPSLQAAFVDYGGNRHGFLAFSEIHPDYYQIPVADREALLAEEKALAEAQQAAQDAEDSTPAPRRRRRARGKAARVEAEDAVATQESAAGQEEISSLDVIDLGEADGDPAIEGSSPMELVGETPVETPAAGEENTGEEGRAPAEVPDVPAAGDSAESAAREGAARGTDASGEAVGDVPDSDEIEAVADDDTPEEIRPPRRVRPRKYKIQEVIKVRQIMLVQVVKEERGNKGAALTTYLSLAGRYCVLMPNTARGGGISRKITNPADRKKLKQIASEIKVPEGAGLIIRTAGAKRTKAEIKRDYEYLQRLWEQIRELTLKSIAPAKIYEEGNLIKRSIRDLYNREIDEVLVEGEEGYRTAKDFMKMIMPSHARKVVHYDDPMPLFARYQVESYLAGMFNPTVQLKSGGYIVIGVTEALVAIDVNSGRATKEGSIEETALKTNLEAAEEVARQLRLRDLAGLIVIDFIDMDERRNNAAVEKRLKECLKHDRARIQVGRISGFGLLEMSRQRLRPGMIETTTQLCSHCHGTGLIRSDDNMALSILRQIEEEGVRGRSREVLLKAPVGIINFLVNSKREHIKQIEERYGLSVRLEADPHLVSPDFTLEKFRTASRSVAAPATQVISIDDSMPEPSGEEETATAVPEEGEAGARQPKKRRRRRRRRRGGGAGAEEANGALQAAGDQEDDGGQGPEEQAGQTAESTAAGADSRAEASDAGEAAQAEAVQSEEQPEEKPSRRRSSRRRRKPAAAAEESSAGSAPQTGDADGDVSETAGNETPAARASGAENAEEDANPKKKPATRKRAARKAVSKAGAGTAEQEKAGDKKAEESSGGKEPVGAAAAQGDADAVSAEEAKAGRKKAPARKRSRKKASAGSAASAPQAETAAAEGPAAAEAEPAESLADTAPVAESTSESGNAESKPRKRGWWAFGG